MPGVAHVGAALPVRSGRLSINHSSRRLKRGQPVEQLGVERLDREERNEADHRPDLERHRAAVGQVQNVVVEAVFVVSTARSRC